MVWPAVSPKPGDPPVVVKGDVVETLRVGFNVPNAEPDIEAVITERTCVENDIVAVGRGIAMNQGQYHDEGIIDASHQLDICAVLEGEQIWKLDTKT